MSQIQFDTVTNSPGCTSGANPRCSGGSGGDSFDAYLHKAQSASTTPAKTSGSDSQPSDSQSSPNPSAEDAQAEAAQGSSTQAAGSKPLHPQSRAKNRDPRDATPLDANPAQAQTQAGNGQPATPPTPQSATAPLGATGFPSAAAATALSGALPVAPGQPAAATTANAGAEPTPAPDMHPRLAADAQAGLTTEAQAGLPAAAVNTTDVKAPAGNAGAAQATGGNDLQNRGDVSAQAIAPQGAAETPISPDQVQQRPMDLPAGAAGATTTADVRPGLTTDKQAGLTTDTEAAAASADRDPSQNPSLAGAAAQVQTEQAVQAKTAVTGVSPGGSAGGAERKKNTSDQAGDNPASLAGPAINPDAVAIGAAASTMAAASDPTAMADKDKHSVAGTTVNAVTATTTAGANASPGAAASPVQDSGQASGAAASQQPGSVGQTDQARFLQRVTAAFQSVGDRGGSVRIMLSPPELGSLRLEVSIQNGALSAHLQAETPAARNLLLDNLPGLRDRLAGQNIKVDRFDVDLMDRQPGGGTSGQAFYQSNTNSQGSYRGNSSAGSAGGSVGSVAVAAALTPDSPVVETTRLNVVV